MSLYLLSIEGTDGEMPPAEFLEPIMRELGTLNDEMRAAGVWVFGAGLAARSTATMVRHHDGETLLTDGPFSEGKEHIGGISIIDVADLDAALSWAGRLAAVIGLWIEVRPFQ